MQRDQHEKRPGSPLEWNDEVEREVDALLLRNINALWKDYVQGMERWRDVKDLLWDHGTQHKNATVSTHLTIGKNRVAFSAGVCGSPSDCALLKVSQIEEHDVRMAVVKRLWAGVTEEHARILAIPRMQYEMKRIPLYLQDTYSFDYIFQNTNNKERRSQRKFLASCPDLLSKFLEQAHKEPVSIAIDEKSGELNCSFPIVQERWRVLRRLAVLVYGDGI